MQETKLITTGYELELKSLILKAQHHIYIALFRFEHSRGWQGKKSDIVLQALLDAKKRGIHILIILHKSDPPTKSDFKNILTARLLIAAGIPTRRHPRTASMHAKLIAVDDLWTLCGSHNLTHGALWQNIEASVLIKCPFTAAKANNFFLKLWQETRLF